MFKGNKFNTLYFSSYTHIDTYTKPLEFFCILTLFYIYHGQSGIILPIIIKYKTDQSEFYHITIMFSLVDCIKKNVSKTI